MRRSESVVCKKGLRIAAGSGLHCILKKHLGRMWSCCVYVDLEKKE